MSIIYAPSVTSKSLTVQIVDDSGLAVTGLLAAAFPSLSYQLAGANAAVAFPALSDLAAITTAWASGGVKELTGGYYRLDCPDAMFSAAGKVKVYGEATGKHVLVETIDVSYPQSDVRQLLGTTWLTPAVAGTPDVNAKNLGGTAQTGRDIGASVLLAASQHVIVDSGTVTNLTNLPAVPTDWLTAAGVKADAVTKIQAGLSTYAGADTAGTTTLLSRVTAAVALAGSAPSWYVAPVDVSANVTAIKVTTDKISFTGAGPYTVNANASISGNVTVGAYAAGQDPATLVLDVAASGHNTAGTIGAKINAAGGAADPLLNAVPGSYVSGTAGAALGRIGSGQIVTTAPVAQNGNFTLVQGATYYAADGQSVDFTDASAGWPNLTGGSVQLRGYFGSQLYTKAGVIVTAGGGSQKVRFEFSATDTTGYALGQRPFDALATLASGHTVLLVSMQGTISAL